MNIDKKDRKIVKDFLNEFAEDGSYTEKSEMLKNPLIKHFVNKVMKKRPDFDEKIVEALIKLEVEVKLHLLDYSYGFLSFIEDFESSYEDYLKYKVLTRALCYC